MFNNFSYIAYTLLFCVPVIALFWWRKSDLIVRNRRAVLGSVVCGILFQLIADPVAEAWGAWFFTPDKILGLWILNFPIENILFFIFVPLAISMFVLVCIDWKLRRKHSWLVG